MAELEGRKLAVAFWQKLVRRASLVIGTDQWKRVVKKGALRVTGSKMVAAFVPFAAPLRLQLHSTPLTHSPRRGAAMTLSAPSGAEPVRLPAAAGADAELVARGGLTPGVVHEVSTPEEFDALLDAAGPDGLVVADFLARWCRKCICGLRMRRVARGERCTKLLTTMQTSRRASPSWRLPTRMSTLLPSMYVDDVRKLSMSNMKNTGEQGSALAA